MYFILLIMYLFRNTHKSDSSPKRKREVSYDAAAEFPNSTFPKGQMFIDPDKNIESM